MESREKGGVTGVTEEAGMSRGGGEGASRHWSPSYRTSWVDKKLVQILHE